MRIAVTYENGHIFQHFGRTEQFKVYDVQEGRIIASEIIGSNGIGHGALAGLLADKAVEVLICGGLGGGALNALTNAGITVVAGAEGDADQAVESYLGGELVSSGANCDHHHHGEGHECGHHSEGQEGGCGEKMPAKTSKYTTRVHSTTAQSLIPPMTAASPWSSSAALA